MVLNNKTIITRDLSALPWLGEGWKERGWLILCCFVSQSTLIRVHWLSRNLSWVLRIQSELQSYYEGTCLSDLVLYFYHSLMAYFSLISFSLASSLNLRILQPSSLIIYFSPFSSGWLSLILTLFPHYPNILSSVSKLQGLEIVTFPRLTFQVMFVMAEDLPLPQLLAYEISTAWFQGTSALTI